ncbi:MAG: SprB repeat-containing protein, partial [Bacteroidetes bacterium]|nr:SprB repeat-containing protein [Bacteroidota bacterium]
CEVDVTVTITEPDYALAASYIQTDVLCFGDATGAIDLTVTGGTPPYTYAWTTSDGEIPPGQEDDQDLSGLIAGTYTVTVTDDNGCEDIASITLTQPDILLCSIDPFPYDNPLCGANENNYLNATVTGGTGMYTYAWTVVGFGWEIVDGSEDDQIVYFSAGSSDATFYLTVTDENNCVSNCEIDVNSCIENHYCTYTKGFYGNIGGLSCNLSTAKEIMLSVIGEDGSKTFGLPDHSFTLNWSDIYNEHIFTMLPGGGKSYALECDAYYWPENETWDCIKINKKGAIYNNLLAQTMALYFNMGWNDGQSNGGFSLGELELEGSILVSADAINCGTQPIPFTELTYKVIPISVLELLCNYSTDPTVENLFDLANDFLGNGEIAQANPKLYGDLTLAVTSINEAFDGCKVFMGFEGEYECGEKSELLSGTDNQDNVFNIDVNIVPNPFKTDTEIRLKLSHSSNVRIEVYTLRGEKFAELFDGYVNADELVSVPWTVNNVYDDNYMVCVIHTKYGVITKPLLIRK